MFRNVFARQLIALSVSLSLAVPTTAFAKDDQSSGNSGAKDGVPSFIQEVKLADGRTAMLVGVPVEERFEGEVFAQIARTDRGNTIFATSGPGDKVFSARAVQTAMASGNVNWMSTFAVANDATSEFYQSERFAPAVRDLARKAIKRISDFCHSERNGLLTAVYVSGLSTGYIMYETSSVSAGMQALVALFGWAAFQGMFTKTWDKYLESGANVVKTMVGGLKRLFGRDVTSVEERMFEIAGKFHASWLANTAVVSFVFFSAGTLDSVSQALWYGFLSSYDIIDPSISDKVKQGKIHESVFKKFVLWRILAGSVFEVAAFMQVPYVQMVLAVLTVGGLSYLAIGHHLDEAARRTTRVTKKAVTQAKGKFCESFFRKKSTVANNDT